MPRCSCARCADVAEDVLAFLSWELTPTPCLRSANVSHHRPAQVIINHVLHLRSLRPQRQTADGWLMAFTWSGLADSNRRPLRPEAIVPPGGPAQASCYLR